MHKKFEINRTSGFLLINFLNVGLFRFGWEKFACFFLCAVVSDRRNGTYRPNYSFCLDMKMMQIYFYRAVVPLSIKI